VTKQKQQIETWQRLGRATALGSPLQKQIFKQVRNLLDSPIKYYRISDLIQAIAEHGGDADTRAAYTEAVRSFVYQIMSKYGLISESSKGELVFNNAVWADVLEKIGLQADYKNLEK
jgi:hypothetical protein